MNKYNCPQCGEECAISATGRRTFPCGHNVRKKDVDRFNNPSGYRSLQHGCFNEELIPSGERIRVFSYISSGAEIKGMLLSLRYRMVSEKLPSDREMEEDDGSYPVCSGEQIWIKGMSTAYVNRQYCGESSFRGNTHIIIVGVISDWKKIVSLIEKYQERKERNRGREWHVSTGKWGRWVLFRRATYETFVRNPKLVEETFEATEGFRMIFRQA